MAIETTPWDVQDYLKTSEDRAAYLQSAFEESSNDPGAIASAIGDLARAVGMSKIANDAGVTREGLYKGLAADGNPSLATVVKVLNAMGMRLSVERVDT